MMQLSIILLSIELAHRFIYSILRTILICSMALTTWHKHEAGGVYLESNQSYAQHRTLWNEMNIQAKIRYVLWQITTQDTIVCHVFNRFVFVWLWLFLIFASIYFYQNFILLKTVLATFGISLTNTFGTSLTIVLSTSSQTFSILVLQWCSSDQSPQSLSPSHLHDLLMHFFPLLQENWLLEQWQRWVLASRNKPKVDYSCDAFIRD